MQEQIGKAPEANGVRLVSISPETAGQAAESAVPAGRIGEEEIREAARVLQEYKRGKANLEARIIDNEQWWNCLLYTSQEPVKIGLAPVQRDDTEYEFDIVLDIARNHVATASKDTTFLDGYGAVITPELGERLKLWLDEGEESPRCEVCGQIIHPNRGRSVRDILSGSNEMCIRDSRHIYGHQSYCRPRIVPQNRILRP